MASVYHAASWPACVHHQGRGCAGRSVWHHDSGRSTAPCGLFPSADSQSARVCRRLRDVGFGAASRRIRLHC